MFGNGDALHRLITALRYFPLLAFSLLAGSFVIVGNPGLFWDDWVWIYQDPAENLRIGNELGIWWAGHLSNAIYATKNPVLLLKIVTLLACLIAAVAASYTLWKCNIIDITEAVFLTALLVSSHIAIVRFLNSVTMYNVYIASFWIGCALLVSGPNKRFFRLTAILFFFFSFHLNSLLFLYVLVVIWLFMQHSQGTNLTPLGNKVDELSEHSSIVEKPANPVSTFSTVMARSAAILSNIFNLETLRSHLKADWLFIVTPLIFFITVKMASLLLSTALSDQPRIYSDYNTIQFEKLFTHFFRLPSLFASSLKQYFNIIIESVPRIVIYLFIFISLLFSFFIPIQKWKYSLKHIIFQLFLSFILFLFAVYPYVLVGKEPRIYEFYEARNIMPAGVSIALFLIASTNAAICLFASRLPALLMMRARNAAIGAIIGMTLSCQFVFGTDLLKDWIRQRAIFQFLTEQKTTLEKFGTIKFVDKSVGFQINRRFVWNYEYTGQLIEVFGTKEKLGISAQEYDSWPRKVPLIKDPVLKKRYNLTDYNPSKPSVVVTINNGLEYPELKTLLFILRRYWQSYSINEIISSYFIFSIAVEYTEAHDNVIKMKKIMSALESFKAETGIYPYTTALPPQVSTLQDSLIAVQLPSQRTIPAYLNEFPHLSSRFGLDCLPDPKWQAGAFDEIDRNGRDAFLCKVRVSCFVEGCGFLYMSDGVDYKLVYIKPVDLSFAQHAYSELMDPVRAGYGFWTRGATRW